MRRFGQQRGGFAVGLIIGVLVGVGLALAVALYVTRVPVPFVNKVPQRSAEQDAAEAERNRNWDPNAPLASRPAPPRPASAVSATPPPPAATAAPVPSTTTAAPAPNARTQPAPPRAAPEPPRVAASAPPRIAAASASPPLSANAAADPFTYFVQAGAYVRNEDAEQQRARLAMLGYTAKVTEREQNGRTMYRVRVGPFDKKDAAEGAQQRLSSSGVDAALVRVQK